jgi:hypothetical protein
MDLTYLKEEGYNLDLLGTFLSTVTEPFSVSAQLYDEEFTEGFKQVDSRMTRYQVMYLALSEFNTLYLTTLTEGAVAYIPVTNIYDYSFPRDGGLRKEMDHIARQYSRELKHFVFNHTHKFIAAMVSGGFEEVGLVFAKENKGGMSRV